MRLRVKVRLLKAEVVETLLYGCMTWSPNKPDYDRLRRVHHSMLPPTPRMAETEARRPHPHINSHNQSPWSQDRFQALWGEGTPHRKNTNQRWYTHISQLTKFMPPPEKYKSEVGSQPTMCQVHTGTYVSLLAPGKTDYTAYHPRKTTTYMLHVVPITIVVVVVVVVLTLTRIINSVVTGQAPTSHSGAEEYPREKHKQPNVVRYHAYITAYAIHASTRNI